VIVYKVANSINGKIYIGKTSYSLEQRKKSHIYASSTKRTQSTLHDAIRKHGAENFFFNTLCYCLTNEDLCNMEKFMISFFDSKKHGYNSTDGGEGAPGFHPNDVTRQKHRAFMIGNTHTKGYKHNEATRLKMSTALRKRWAIDKAGGKQIPRVSWLGKKHTDETKLKLSLIKKGCVGPNKGKPMSDSAKEKLKAFHLGRRHTDETKLKLSLISKRRYHEKNTR
jgi:group I intron endonuclease